MLKYEFYYLQNLTKNVLEIHPFFLNINRMAFFLLVKISNKK